MRPRSAEVFRFVREGETLVVNRWAGVPLSGLTFLLVHGIGVSSRYYERLALMLASRGHVHTVDLPGFGAAPTPSRRTGGASASRQFMSIERYAQLLCAYLDARSLHECVLVGHSMGSQIVIEMARTRPDLAACVVLIGPVVDPAAPTAIQQSARLALDLVAETPASNLTVLVDYVRCGPRWYLRELPAMLGYPTLPRFSEVQVPCLVMRGRRDTVAPRSWARALAAASPGTPLVEIPGAAHVAQFTRPHAVADVVLRFAGDRDRFLAK